MPEPGLCLAHALPVCQCCEGKGADLVTWDDPLHGGSAWVICLRCGGTGCAE